jgi:hypothetical protein
VQLGSDFLDRTLASTRAADLPGPPFGGWARSRRLDDPRSSEQQDCSQRESDFGHEQEERKDEDDQEPDRDCQEESGDEPDRRPVAEKAEIQESVVIEITADVTPLWPPELPLYGPVAAAGRDDLYSHSMVLGGFDEMSSATRFTAGISLMIRLEIVSSRS